MRPIPNIAVTFIKQQEGCVLRVYDDKQPKVRLTAATKILGVLTAGYGHTGGLEIGQRVTQAMADAWLLQDLKEDARGPLYGKIGSVVDDLTEHQYAALLSFVFNLGTGNPGKPEWKIWRLLRGRHFDQVQAEFAKFCNWNGKKSQSMLDRRNREAALWAIGEPNATAEPAPPSSVTRREPTPPTPSDPVAPQKSAQILTLVGSAATATTAATAQITQAINPFADKSQVLQNIASALAIIAAIAAVVGLALVWIKKHRDRG